MDLQIDIQLDPQVGPATHPLPNHNVTLQSMLLLRHYKYPHFLTIPPWEEATHHSSSPSNSLPLFALIKMAKGNIFQGWMPYLAMISLQFGYAGMNVITKVSLNHGMSHYVLVVYRHAFATLSIAPFALIFERKVRPEMTFSIFMQIFALGLLGPVIDQNLYYVGLKFTSPTFSCAMSNILPAMTFVMAVLCRMEKVHIRKLRCQAKVIGTVVTVAGAMMMTLYKGPIVDMLWTRGVHSHAPPAPPAAVAKEAKDWLKGSIFLIIATWAWASLFVVQAYTLKRYSAQLSLTTLICFMGTLQAIVVTFAMERKPSAWKVGFDINLLAAAYAGIVTSSIAYYVQGLVINRKGPVFASAFSPLMMVVVAVMGSFILAEKIYLGGIIGAVLIVLGLYAVLWGKHKEKQETKEEIPIKENEDNGHKKEIAMEVGSDQRTKFGIKNNIVAPLEQNELSIPMQMEEAAMKP